MLFKEFLSFTFRFWARYSLHVKLFLVITTTVEWKDVVEHFLLSQFVHSFCVFFSLRFSRWMFAQCHSTQDPVLLRSSRKSRGKKCIHAFTIVTYRRETMWSDEPLWIHRESLQKVLLSFSTQTWTERREVLRRLNLSSRTSQKRDEWKQMQETTMLRAIPHWEVFASQQKGKLFQSSRKSPEDSLKLSLKYSERVKNECSQWRWRASFDYSHNFLERIILVFALNLNPREFKDES